MKTSLLLPVLGFLMSGQAPSLMAAASPKPVLLVIANQDFYYREYSDTRSSLEGCGLVVKVAAAAASPQQRAVRRSDHVHR